MKEDPNMINLSIESFDIYKVHDAFPKLDLDNVDSRISKVKYSINLDQCDEFIVNSEEII